MKESDAPLKLLSAGSLKGAVQSFLTAFGRSTGIRVRPEFAPAGLLRARIEEGEVADLFTSANLAHPQALADSGRAGPPVIFARNRLCAFLRPGLRQPSSLLDLMLDPATRLGMSTPKADPCGDYTWTLFERADVIRPGARSALEAKALRLTGGPDSLRPPSGCHYVAWHLGEDRADIFLSYRSAASAVLRDLPDAEMVELPEGLAVGADYALSLLSDRPEAARLALSLLSPDEQHILADHGFEPVTAPRAGA